MVNALVTIEDIRRAAERIKPYVSKTPVVAMTPSGLQLKAENLHPTGAFKLRGAFNLILSLSPDEQRRGIVAYSSGNHAQAVAFAARKLGVHAVVVMPGNAPAAKVDATRRWDPEIIVVGNASEERMRRANELAAEKGYTIIPPYDHPAILAGAGTIGLELFAQVPNLSTVFAPVGGGGLLGGLATCLKAVRPGMRIVGVEPSLASDAFLSFKADHRVKLPADQTSRTIADGLRLQQLGEVPWRHIRAYVDEIVTVEEDAIRESVRRIAKEARLVAEPSGAVAAAAAIFTPGMDGTVAILSGGNADQALLSEILGSK